MGTALIDRIVSGAPDPQAAGSRLERLRGEPVAAATLDRLPEQALRELVNLVSVSRFLAHALIRDPGLLDEFAADTPGPRLRADEAGDFESLKRFKYRALLRIARTDLAGKADYAQILTALSDLADTIIARALDLTDRGDHGSIRRLLTVIALGKLGARELNFSSDIDLIFVSANSTEAGMEVGDLQSLVYGGIRSLVRALEDATEDGFLYRVDLNLRPWGRSGPLCMAIDDTENYYEGSSEPWEQFAWLRARSVTGATALGEELIQRLFPFVFRRSLSTADLERFLDIKKEMQRVRERAGHWNVKVGDGGIRDIEFFVQVLQIVNASSHAALRSTNTLEVLAALEQAGFVPDSEASAIRESYLFLRRLENRLQMVDEQQIHELPDDGDRRLVMARSLGITGQGDEEVLKGFEARLGAHRSVARRCFERILPGGGE